MAIQKGGPFAVVAHWHFEVSTSFWGNIRFNANSKGGTLTKISDNFFLEKNLSGFFPQNIDQIYPKTHRNLSLYPFYAFILIFGISKKVAIQKGGPFAVVAHWHFEVSTSFWGNIRFHANSKGGTLTKISDNFFLQKNLSDFFPQNID